MSSSIFIHFDPQAHQWICAGDWTLVNVKQIQKQIKTLKLPKNIEISLNGSGITRMDTAGAWLLNSLDLKKIHCVQLTEKTESLLNIIKKSMVPMDKIPTLLIPNPLAKLGKGVCSVFLECIAFLAFVGQLSIEWVRVIFSPKRWRINTLSTIIDRMGFQALPIIALLSFMIGVVISYQMGNQLRSYGANVFIVDLLGLSILREFGPMITAIMVAGRTGSAFTAQLGIMKINQEIDALNAMGVGTGNLLLLPRIIGLFITLPLLTMWANVFGILGGMLMANNMLGITWYEFLDRFHHEIPVRALWIGLGKTPVFALLIASISCFQGMQVRGSADSVGKMTTRSVVLAIFFIIVADAIFSVIFSQLNL